MSQKFGASPIIIGLLFMADSIVYGLASPIIGWLGDRYDKNVMMLIGMIMSAALLPVIALPDEMWLVFVAVCGLGVGLALLMNPTMPELAALVDQLGGGAYGQAYVCCPFFSVDTRSPLSLCYTQAIYNFFYSLGMLAGPLLGGLAVDNIGFMWGMVACGGLIFAFVPVLLIAHWRSFFGWCCCPRTNWKDIARTTSAYEIVG